MRPLGNNTRIVVLSGAALLLASWNLFGLVADPAPVPESQSAGPMLKPELVGGHGSPSDARPDRHFPGVPRDSGRDDQAGPDAVSAPVRIAAGNGAVAEPPLQAVQGRPDAAFCQLLDHVFGPDRFVHDPGAEPSAFSPGPETDVAVRGTPGGGPTTARSPRADPPDLDAEKQDAQRRPTTEKAFYEGFVALAQKDPQELLRQADAVMGGNAENCQKVAVLRAIYDTDRAQGLAYFTQAISRQPDVSKPEAVSIPVFVVDFLSKRLADPGVKAVLETVAMTGNITVSPDLQRRAAGALFAQATAADRQRYASNPIFQAAAAGSDTAP